MARTTSTAKRVRAGAGRRPIASVRRFVSAHKKRIDQIAVRSRESRCRRSRADLAYRGAARISRDDVGDLALRHRHASVATHVRCNPGSTNVMSARRSPDARTAARAGASGCRPLPGSFITPMCHSCGKDRYHLPRAPRRRHASIQRVRCRRAQLRNVRLVQVQPSPSALG